MRFIILGIGLFALGLPMLTPSSAVAEGPKVLQTFFVEVEPTNHDAYLAKIKELNPIVQRLGLPEVRV